MNNRKYKPSESQEAQKRILGVNQDYRKALIENAEREQIKRDSQKYREIVKKTQEMLKRDFS